MPMHPHTLEARQKIARSQEERWAIRRSLVGTRRELLGLLIVCEAMVRELAEEGRSDAGVVVEAIDRARDKMSIAGIEAETFMQDARYGRAS